MNPWQQRRAFGPGLGTQKPSSQMKPLVAVPLLLIAEIMGSGDQMPTDRSLNRVKKISRSRFGQQTSHIAKEEAHCSLQEKTQLAQPTKAAKVVARPEVLVPRTAANQAPKTGRWGVGSFPRKTNENLKT